MEFQAPAPPERVAVVRVPEAGLRELVVSALVELGFAVPESDLDPLLDTSAPPGLIVIETTCEAGRDHCKSLLDQPGLDGVPVVALVDQETVDSIDDLCALGITDFITLPLTRGTLVARLRHVLRATATRGAEEMRSDVLDAAARIAGIGHWTWDLATGDMVWSEQARRLLEAPPELLQPQLTDLLIRVHEDDANRLAQFLDTALSGEKVGDIDFRVTLADGETRVLLGRAEAEIDAEGRPRSLAGTFQDITERKKVESRIRFLAFYDNLTGLPNRLQFGELLKRSLTAARRARRMAAVMFMDLDNFKMVNDTAGHSEGDRLLRAAAERLKQALRVTDTVARQPSKTIERTVARVGGDEFILLLPEIAHPDDPAKVARRILELFKVPFKVAGEEIIVSTSIGISIYPQDGDNPDDLLKNADVALYHAKDAGRNNFQFFSPAQNDAAFRRLSLESSLRKALEREELVLHYQPQVLAREGRLIGVEALVRWNHPELGLVYPGQFIPLAEETGLIQHIDEWVLRAACRQSALWERAGLPKFRVAVNLSGHEFRRSNLVERVLSIVFDAGRTPQNIELEITEGVLMEEAARTMQILSDLKACGFTIAMDDFGTGYSSLAYLKKFRADILKIDRSFVRDAATDPDDAAIVSAIVSLARTLKMTPLAEGVENTLQRAMLHELGCELMQGHLFGKPVPPEGIAEMLGVHANGSITPPASEIPATIEG